MAASTRIKKPVAPRPAHWLDGTQHETWHSTAPKDVVEAYTEGDGQEGWEAWTDHLEGRRNRPYLGTLLRGGEESLLWGMPASLRESETAELVKQLGRANSFEKRKQRRRWADLIADWLDSASIASASTAYAYECLAYTHSLVQLTSCIGENLWWKLVNHLTTMAREARQQDALTDPLVWQLLAGELPLALAYLLPEIRVCQDQSLVAWSTIAQGLNELVDEGGVPATPVVPLLPALVASWTRARAIADRVTKDSWQDPASVRYESTLLCLARIGEVDQDLWRAAEKFTQQKKARRLLRQLADGQVVTAKMRLPFPAIHSEKNCFGLLRSTWATDAPSLTVSYSDPVPRIELVCQGEVLCSGPWRFDVSLDGEPRTVTGRWDIVCWYSDKDVDFLEIEAPLGDGLKVQRQFLLARQDEVLLLADAVVADRPARINYDASLPIATHVGFHGAEETREGHLVGNDARALVLPLELSEWRSDSHSGSLEMTSAGLTLRHSRLGSAIYAPLFLDLNKNRSKEECTWRKLTVAAQRVPQRADVAVGFRAQIGKTNWLVYRSLAEPGIRSLLGQQVKAEFLFGRMKRNGGCARLLEIESIEPTES